MKGNTMKIRLLCLIALVLSTAACTDPSGDTLFGSRNLPGKHDAVLAIDKA